MPLLSTVGSLVRLPFRLVGGAVGLAKAAVGGSRSGSDRTPPFPTTPQPAPDPRPAARSTPVQKAPAKGPVDVPAAPAAKKAPAPKAPAAGPDDVPAPVTDIDATASADDVHVTPSDVADTMGTQLDERPPSPS